ncbi:MAG: hypothetical protein U0Y68_10720 [Blastocatellia bacterium]
MIKNTTKPVFLLLNKVDFIKDKSALLPVIEQYNERFQFAEIVPISALASNGMGDCLILS